MTDRLRALVQEMRDEAITNRDASGRAYELINQVFHGACQVVYEACAEKLADVLG